MRVLIAFDKFRDSLKARQACEIAAETLLALHKNWDVDLCPLTDGGEGFCEILTETVEGRIEHVTVRGPLALEIKAPLGITTWGKIPKQARATLATREREPDSSELLAIIDMASASGVSLLNLSQRNPWYTTSIGTGDLILAAAHRGAKRIIMGVGGSATNDLGIGALAALGLRPRYHSSCASDILPTPMNWRHLVGFEGSLDDDLPELFIACDVTNPLLGDQGATYCFGPQKGLPEVEIPRLDGLMAHAARLLQEHCGCSESLINEPGSGAAGGIAYGLMCAAKAQLVLGSVLVSSWLDLSKRIQNADIVITGEGCFDRGSLGGKGPGAVITQALKHRKSVHVYAGRLDVDHLPKGLIAHEISPRNLRIADSLAKAPFLLREALIADFGN